MESIRIQADCVVVSPERILCPGQVVVRLGRIVEVSQHTLPAADLILENTIILPGLVNPHTHLEFSELQHPLPAGSHFPEWIAAVVGYRHSLQQSPASLALHSTALARGAAECFQSGTALIADILTQPSTADSARVANQELPNPTGTSTDTGTDTRTTTGTGMAKPRMRRDISTEDWLLHLADCSTPKIFAFPEIVGLSAQRLCDTATWATSLLDNFSANHRPADFYKLGVSPHAPYSLHYPSIEEQMNRFRRRTTMAMHLAESLDERQWAEFGSGPFRSAFERLGIACPSERLQIAQAIQMLGRQHRSLLIHGNYLTTTEMDDVAANGNISVVYCPRTHHYFEHAAYPWSALRRRGIRVVLGTDSRASNPDLNLWSEMLHARSQHADLDPSTALSAITSQAARALGCHRDFGSLQVGSMAYINTISGNQEIRQNELLEALTSSPQRIQPLNLHAIS